VQYGPQISITSSLTSLIVVASSGTGMLYTPATAVRRGSRALRSRRRSAARSAFFPAMPVAMVGLAAVRIRARFSSTLKWLGVAYLFSIFVESSG
jgi:threonine/homoserine/homoserine lactone efflux protein